MDLKEELKHRVEAAAQYSEVNEINSLDFVYIL